MNKLVWSIIAFFIGLLVFLGVHQYIGAAIVFVGLVLFDQYAEERKKIKKTNNND